MIAKMPTDADAVPALNDVSELTQVSLPENYAYLGAVQKAQALEVALEKMKKHNGALLTELSNRTQWEAVRLSTTLRERAAEEHQRTREAITKALEAQGARFNAKLKAQQLQLDSAGELKAAHAAADMKESLRESFQHAMEKQQEAARQSEEEALEALEINLTQRHTSEAEARLGEIANVKLQLRAMEQVIENDEDYKRRSHQVHRVAHAVLSLTDQMEKSAPFGEQAAVLREVAQSDEVIALAVTQLPESTCRRGVQTYLQLQEGFANLEGETRRAALMPEDGGAVWWGFTKVLSSLKFKQKGQVSGASCDDILTRAEDHLNRGNLEAAVREVSALQGLAAGVMNDWRSSALERLRVEQAIHIIKAHAACQSATLK
jgi:mitofilin